MDTSGFHEFESIQKPPPPDISFTHEVQNLCSKFDGSGQCHEFCLGSLDCANGTWNIMKRDRIPPVIPFTISTVSLDLLLERRMLEEVARLELGVQLASAVLQLHST